MKFMIVSTSLNPESNGRILCKEAFEVLKSLEEEVEFLDLQKIDLPPCDGGSCYNNPVVKEVTKKLGRAKGILVGVPVYNFQAGSQAKSLVELTMSEAWEGKVVGFICAAGGRASYMSVMSLANSLMLDFRSIILPRFVYAVGEDFKNKKIKNMEIKKRIEEITQELVRVTKALE